MSKQAKIQSILMLAIISIAMGQFIVFAVLAPLIRAVGLQEYQGGLILSFSSIVFALSSGVWGRLSSIYGRKKVMLIGLCGYCFGTILFVSGFYAGFQHYLTGFMLFCLLATARMLQSTLMGATSPATTAYMADITPPEQRVKGMGLIGSANSLGTILGPAIAAPLIMLHLLAPLLAASAITLVTAFIVLLWLPKDEAQDNSGNQVKIGQQIIHTLRSYFDPRYSNLLLIGVLMFMSYAMSQQTLGYLIQDRLQISPEQAASILAEAFIYSAVFSLVAQLGFVARLKISAPKLLFIGLPLMMVGYLILIQLSAEMDAMIAFSCVGFGFGLCLPGFSAAASLSVSSEEQGAVAGVIAGAPALGYILGPTLGSVLYQWNELAPYVASAVLNGGLTLAIFYQLRSARGKRS